EYRAYKIEISYYDRIRRGSEIKPQVLYIGSERALKLINTTSEDAYVGVDSHIISEFCITLRDRDSAPDMWPAAFPFLARYLKMSEKDFIASLNSKTIMLVGAETERLPNELKVSSPGARVIVVNPDKAFPKDKLVEGVILVNDIVQNLAAYSIKDVDLVFSSGLFNPEYKYFILGDKDYVEMFTAMRNVFFPEGRMLITAGAIGSHEELKRDVVKAGLNIEDIGSGCMIYLLSRNLDRSIKGLSAEIVDVAIENFGGIEEILKNEIKDMFNVRNIALGMDKAARSIDEGLTTIYFLLLARGVHFAQAPPGWNIGSAIGILTINGKEEPVIILSEDANPEDVAHEIRAVLIPDLTHQENLSIQNDYPYYIRRLPKLQRRIAESLKGNFGKILDRRLDSMEDEKAQAGSGIEPAPEGINLTNLLLAWTNISPENIEHKLFSDGEFSRKDREEIERFKRLLRSAPDFRIDMESLGYNTTTFPDLKTSLMRDKAWPGVCYESSFNIARILRENGFSGEFVTRWDNKNNEFENYMIVSLGGRRFIISLTQGVYLADKTRDLGVVIIPLEVVKKNKDIFPWFSSWPVRYSYKFERNGRISRYTLKDKKLRVYRKEKNINVKDIIREGYDFFNKITRIRIIYENGEKVVILEKPEGIEFPVPAYSTLKAPTNGPVGEKPQVKEPVLIKRVSAEGVSTVLDEEGFTPDNSEKKFKVLGAGNDKVAEEELFLSDKIRSVEKDIFLLKNKQYGVDVLRVREKSLAQYGEGALLKSRKGALVVAVEEGTGGKLLRHELAEFAVRKIYGEEVDHSWADKEARKLQDGIEIIDQVNVVNSGYYGGFEVVGSNSGMLKPDLVVSFADCAKFR
ncbi:MAG: hypothetical protein Q7S42_06155, partial [Candidatus Omnitrophota bacterium]|nr:hypothetical protein [Candidatus Omnitrophota bacterium]